MTQDERVKKIHDSWPAWKKEYCLTKYSSKAKSQKGKKHNGNV